MTDYFTPRPNRRNPYFEALLKEGTATSPIGAHSQGMSRLAFALLAGLERNDLASSEREARERLAAAGWKVGQPDPRTQPVPFPASPANPPSFNGNVVAGTPLIPLPRPRPFE